MQATLRRLAGGPRTAPRFIKSRYGSIVDTAREQSAPRPTKAVRAKSPSPILDLIWEKDPGPINCLTYATTTNLLDAAHPLRLRMQRKMLSFDRSKFHFTCQVPASLHKKPTIRHRVKRRFKHSFIEDLKASGWDEDGEPLKMFANEKLHGALCLKINGDDAWAAREVEWTEIKALTRWALDHFLQGRAKISSRHIPRDAVPLKGFVLDDNQTPIELQRRNRALAEMTPEEAKEKFGNPSGLPFPVWRIHGLKDPKVAAAASKALKAARRRDAEKSGEEMLSQTDALSDSEDAFGRIEDDFDDDADDSLRRYKFTHDRKPKDHREQKRVQAEKKRIREENKQNLKTYNTEERQALYRQLQQKSKEQMQAYEDAKRAATAAAHAARLEINKTLSRDKKDAQADT